MALSVPAADAPAVNPVLRIADIQIGGNEKTREYIIRREMSLHEGKLVAADELEELLAEDRKRITNTRLFVTVHTQLVPLGNNHVQVQIEVLERWYVVPVPIFSLADRNFNDWWTNQNRDMRRVNYGLKFNHYNFMGRAERMSVTAQFGFARSLRLAYYMPYIDKSRKNGLGFSALYFDNNNVALRTLNHKRIFLTNNGQEMRRTFGGSMTYTRRASFYNTHLLGASFYANTFADTVLRSNPEFHPQLQNDIRYFTLTYGFLREMRDNVSYPLRGFNISAYASKTGLGIFDDVNILEVDGTLGTHLPLAKRIFWSNTFNTRMSVAPKQPYYLMNGLGYGQKYVRGMELYVLEGQHHVLNKTELKWQMLNKEYNISRHMPLDQFSKIPLALYPKIFFDAAYVHMPNPQPGNDFLVNRPVWGTGIGLDIVSFYDFVLQLEYSMNSRMERGFFINMNRGF
ncbi:BamA/TamA family outer membrane protein [Cesiribacter andamanensis]|uniref:Outer membrane protein/protective antigen OMA87 n=1 Tax=Cesiribacter andamanensis AMV16 TaxID=1279009 RepID=M7NMR3_9BACT|nr:BamA/TamA family outer membrane protein [Cesiribacter andamanensis]EMR03055.1 Outer membrane protein/protective antigen OMA87 [Cesiribacter andamanensis AMV16]